MSILKNKHPANSPLPGWRDTMPIKEAEVHFPCAYGQVPTWIMKMTLSGTGAVLCILKSAENQYWVFVLFLSMVKTEIHPAKLKVEAKQKRCRDLSAHIVNLIEEFEKKEKCQIVVDIIESRPRLAMILDIGTIDQ